MGNGNDPAEQVPEDAAERSLEEKTGDPKEGQLRDRFPVNKVVSVRRSSGQIEPGWVIVLHTRNIRDELCARVGNVEKNIFKDMPLKELAEYNQ